MKSGPRWGTTTLPGGSGRRSFLAAPSGVHDEVAVAGTKTSGRNVISNRGPSSGAVGP